MEYILATLVVGVIVYIALKHSKPPVNPPGNGGGQSGNKNQPK